jgi:2-keto-3-deoxy-L-rhamnonate aldolase RhmA
MRVNRVKRALMSGKVQIGTWVNVIRTPQIARLLATAGFDFMYIDMEHSNFSIETVGDLCCYAQAAGIVPIVRPPAKDAHLLSRPLDSGAMGLLIPHVDTREEAEAVVRTVKYPPRGTRGFNLQSPHSDFALAKAEEYIKAADEETLLIVQIESDLGIRNLDAILGVDGIDGAVVGRGDLSADLGVTGDWNHPEVMARVEKMIATCQRHGKIPGLLVPNAAAAKEWIAKGIRLVPCSSDVNLLLDAATTTIKDIRTYVEEIG